MSGAAPRAFGAEGRWARRWGSVVITMAVLLVYWPLSTLSHGLVPGDTLDCWVPWRWFIAAALHDGHFPLWNPYAQSGYPMYADLQGPAWYPFSIAIGGTVGHTVLTLQVLFLAYVVVGGLGMQRLVRQQYGDARIALVIGLAYALGGFFTAHQMHFYAVISAAWMPWLLAAQVRLVARPAWRPAVEAALFQAMLLTGGNHTFSLIGSWLLLALIVARAVPLLRHGRLKLVRLLAFEALFAALALVMACGTVHAVVEVSPYLARASGLAHTDAAFNALTPRALWSWLFPYVVGTDGQWLGTDPTMANGYMGVIVLLLAMLAPFRRRSRTENVIGLFGVVSALAAFGPALPVHRWLWATVPGLNLFRFPSYYQWFVAFAVAVLAAGTLARWPQMHANRPRLVQGLVLCAAGVVASALIWAWMRHGAEPRWGRGGTLLEMITGLRRWHRVLVVAPTTFVALVGLWWWTRRSGPRWEWLLALVGMEMGWATTWAQWNTAVGDHSPAMLQGRIDEVPVGPVWPELDPMARYTDGSATLRYFWRNVQNFEGHPSHDGFNSFWLKDVSRLADEHPALFAAMRRQPLVYLSDSVVASQRYDPARVDPAKDSALVVLGPAAELPQGLRLLPGDELAVSGFDHDGIQLRVRTRHPVFAVLQQAWYPGWEVRVDGRPTELLRANIACFGAVVPGGEHLLEFRFRKQQVPWLLAISLITFFGGAFLLAFTRAPGNARNALLAGLALLALAVAWSLFGHRSKAVRLPMAVGELAARAGAINGATVPLMVNTDRFPALRAVLSNPRAFPLRAGPGDRQEEVLQQLQRAGQGPLWWMDAGLPTAPAVRAILLHRYRVDTVLEVDGFQAALLVPGDGALGSVPLYRDSWNEPLILNAASPWTPAYRVPARDLMAMAPGSMVAMTTYRCYGAAKPAIVVQRNRGDLTAAYERIPLPAGGDGLHTACVVRNLRELRFGGEVVGVYLWNYGPDSVGVGEFSVEYTSHRLDRW